MNTWAGGKAAALFAETGPARLAAVWTGARDAIAPARREAKARTRREVRIVKEDWSGSEVNLEGELEREREMNREKRPEVGKRPVPAISLIRTTALPPPIRRTLRRRN